MDKDTEMPLDILTPQAQQMIETLGSQNTRISEIIAQEDRAVFTAIQKGVDRVNECATSQAQKVGTPCNLPAGYCSLMSMVGKVWTIKTQLPSSSVFTFCVILSIFQVKIDHLAYFVNIWYHYTISKHIYCWTQMIFWIGLTVPKLRASKFDQ